MAATEERERNNARAAEAELEKRKCTLHVLSAPFVLSIHTAASNASSAGAAFKEIQREAAFWVWEEYRR